MEEQRLLSRLQFFALSRWSRQSSETRFNRETYFQNLRYLLLALAFFFHISHVSLLVSVRCMHQQIENLFKRGSPYEPSIFGNNNTYSTSLISERKADIVFLRIVDHYVS